MTDKMKDALELCRRELEKEYGDRKIVAFMISKRASSKEQGAFDEMLRRL